MEHTKLFFDTTSSTLTSTLDLSAKTCEPYDLQVFKKAKKSCWCCIMEIKHPATFKMLFVANDKMLEHVKSIVHPLLQRFYGSMLLCGKESDIPGQISVLKNIWYNIAGMFAFAYLDSIGSIGCSTFTHDVPFSITHEQSISYLEKNEENTVVGMKNSEHLVYMAMLL